MYDFIQRIKNIIPKKNWSFGQDIALIIGVACLAAVAFVVLFTDAYIFYTTIIREPYLARQEQKTEFPVQEIESIINILDKRQKEFVEIILP